jgi:hypothetical protein
MRKQGTSRFCQFGLLLLLLLGMGQRMLAHHFKGLPHYNYFENYPQVPEEEFLGQAGEYEFSLVVYDFQGINRELVEQPDNVRLFLVAFSLRNSQVYLGPATLEILDHGEVVHADHQAGAELENLYSLHRKLPETGKYSLRITLHAEDDLQCVIPFVLSSQKVHWGRRIALGLVLLIFIAAVGARKARVAKDRETAHKAAARKEAILNNA